MRYTEYHNGIAVIKEKLWLKNAMRQLAYWEDLKDTGKLAELPCRPDDKVYIITDSGVVERKVIAIYLTSKATQIIIVDKRGDAEFRYDFEFGKTMFTNKEIAIFIWQQSIKEDWE